MRRSLVILDLKDELAKEIMPTLMQTHTALLWDPSNPDDCTIGFDPLATLPDQSDERFIGECKQVARAWFWATRHGEHTTDPWFINMPLAMMEALFVAFLVAHPTGTFVE